MFTWAINWQEAAKEARRQTMESKVHAKQREVEQTLEIQRGKEAREEERVRGHMEDLNPTPILNPNPDPDPNPSPKYYALINYNNLPNPNL